MLKAYFREALLSFRVEGLGLTFAKRFFRLGLKV